MAKDSLEFYRQTIETVLRKYAEIPYSAGEIKQNLIIDDKIWIQRDGIEDGITDELVEAGIPKDKIVLGFQPPSVRPHTGYAIA